MSAYLGKGRLGLILKSVRRIKVDKLKCFSYRKKHEQSQRGINKLFRALEAVFCLAGVLSICLLEENNVTVDITEESRQEIDRVSLECAGHHFSIKRQQRATEGT